MSAGWLAAAPDGGVLLSSHHALDGTTDIGLSSYDSDGSLQWFSDAGSDDDVDDLCTDIVVDSAGRTVVGHVQADGSDISSRVSKYQTDGTLLWTWEYPDTDHDDTPTAIAVDTHDNVVVAWTLEVFTVTDALLGKPTP